LAYNTFKDTSLDKQKRQTGKSWLPTEVPIPSHFSIFPVLNVGNLCKEMPQCTSSSRSRSHQPFPTLLNSELHCGITQNKKNGRTQTLEENRKTDDKTGQKDKPQINKLTENSHLMNSLNTLLRKPQIMSSVGNLPLYHISHVIQVSNDKSRKSRHN